MNLFPLNKLHNHSQLKKLIVWSFKLCSIALFCSEEKGKCFVPDAEGKKCTVIASKTGNLADIDVAVVKDTLKVFKTAAPATTPALV